MNRLQKVLLFTLGIFVLLIAGVFLFIKLYLTDERLRDIAEPVLEEQLQRDVSIGGFEVRILRSFPDITIGINELAIHSPDRNGEASPDLASVERIWVDMPILPLLQSNVHITALELDAPLILVEVYDDLSTNLIELGQEEEPEVQETESPEESPLQELAIEQIKIRDGQLGYIHADGTLMTVAGLTADLSARLAETALLSGNVSIADAFYQTGGIAYANHWTLSLDLDAEANMDSAWLRIDEALLNIEDLALQMLGRVDHWDTENILFDLSLNAPEASVGSFWSLLPVSLTKDVEGLTSEGVFEVQATVQGELAEGMLPALNADLRVRDGVITYPGLPSSIRGLMLEANITNEALTIQQLLAEADGANLDLNARITQFANPQLEADFALDVDLARIQTYYPLEDSTEISGRLNIDTQLSGPLSHSENIQASGLVLLEGINYQSTLAEQPVQDLNGRIVVENDQLVFNGITLKTGESDLRVDGRLNGYRGFLADSLSDAPEPLLQGEINSTYLNLTEQISEDTTSSFVGPLELPPIRMDVALNADKLEFNGFTFNDASGRLSLENGVMGFEDISAQFLRGVLNASGNFDLSNPLKPLFNGSVALKQLPVSEFFASFSDMDAIVKLGAYLDGLFNSEASFSLSLDKDLNPDYTSAIAKGVFGADQGSFGTTPLQSALSQFTGLAALQTLSFRDWSHAFSVTGEVMHVQDLTFTAGDYAFTVSGSQEFDGSLDYRLSIDLPESASGALANAPVQGALGPVVNLVSTSLTDPQTGRIILDLSANGTFDKPEIKLNTEMMKARLTGQASALAAGVRAEAQARLDSLEQAARARAEAELDEQRQLIEERAREEGNRLLGGIIDSTSSSLEIDSLKEEGANALKDRLNGLIKRKKPNN